MGIKLCSFYIICSLIRDLTNVALSHAIRVLLARGAHVHGPSYDSFSC
jgi:hypothetical protein